MLLIYSEGLITSRAPAVLHAEHFPELFHAVSID